MAWKEFCRGKTGKKDVTLFEFNLEKNLFLLHKTLINQSYQPAYYTPFFIFDPKLRLIHKATVADRVLHQAIFRVLYPMFDKTFIFDSYSCRVGKGTHRGVDRLEEFISKVTDNHRQQAYALKCDVRKFFDSIDQTILLAILKKKIVDPKTLWLIEKNIKSFSRLPGKGLPLGNVTSQLFANIYLNEFDQFVKHTLRKFQD